MSPIFTSIIIINMHIFNHCNLNRIKKRLKRNNSMFPIFTYIIYHKYAYFAHCILYENKKLFYVKIRKVNKKEFNIHNFYSRYVIINRYIFVHCIFRRNKQKLTKKNQRSNIYLVIYHKYAYLCLLYLR